jgi:hypothetical protein
MAELGSVTRDGLIAGDYPIKTAEIRVTGPASFKRGDVVGRKTSDGSYALVNSAKSDGTQAPVGIVCQEITAEADEEAVGAMYVKGEFAAGHLTFGGTDTVEKHRAAMTAIGLIPRGTITEGGVTW